MIGIPLCVHCKNLYSGDISNEGSPTCLAFPTGIPTDIVKAIHNHTESYPGDNGVLFNPKEDYNPQLDKNNVRAARLEPTELENLCPQCHKPNKLCGNCGKCQDCCQCTTYISAHDASEGAGTKKTGYALPEMGPFKCSNCIHFATPNHCDHKEVIADTDVPKGRNQKYAIVHPDSCCNYFHPQDKELAATSEGARKVWQTRKKTNLAETTDTIKSTAELNQHLLEKSKDGKAYVAEVSFGRTYIYQYDSPSKVKDSHIQNNQERGIAYNGKFVSFGKAAITRERNRGFSGDR